MKITLLYFASIREALGGGETLELAGPTTVAGLRDLLIERGGEHARVLARGRAVRVAVERALTYDESLPLHDGAEVAFFPPVTGG